MFHCQFGKQNIKFDSLRGALWRFEEDIHTQNLNVLWYQWGNNTNSVIVIFFYNWINKLFSGENKCLKLERWQGPPNINKRNQHDIVFSFEVFVYSAMSLFRHK